MRKPAFSYAKQRLRPAAQSETPKTGFLTTRPTYQASLQRHALVSNPVVWGDMAGHFWFIAPIKCLFLFPFVFNKLWCDIFELLFVSIH